MASSSADGISRAANGGGRVRRRPCGHGRRRRLPLVCVITWQPPSVIRLWDRVLYNNAGKLSPTTTRSSETDSSVGRSVPGTC